MKMANCVALLGLVLLGCLSDLAVAQRRASCSSYLLSGKTVSMVCPRNFDPVCGTNGRTYPNECSLCKDFLRNRALDKKHDGRCVRLDCTGFLKPGSGLGFSNSCTMDYSPICGTNGITYRNKCQFCNAVASGLEVNLQKYGQCLQGNRPQVYPPQVNPPQVYPPQVNPPQVYPPQVNPPQVYPPQVNPPQVYPPQVNPPQVYPQQNIDCSQQKGANLLCTSEYSPICGSDGRTYGNRCKFCSAVTRSSGSLFFSHHGSC